MDTDTTAERKPGAPARENKMGVMPVPRLVITMALPLMLSLLVQSLYNIVDGIFVGMISEEAIHRHFPGLPGAAADGGGIRGHRRGHQCGGLPDGGGQAV